MEVVFGRDCGPLKRSDALRKGESAEVSGGCVQFCLAAFARRTILLRVSGTARRGDFSTTSGTAPKKSAERLDLYRRAGIMAVSKGKSWFIGVKHNYIGLFRGGTL